MEHFSDKIVPQKKDLDRSIQETRLFSCLQDLLFEEIFYGFFDSVTNRVDN
jgi:hypothetical protein